MRARELPNFPSLITASIEWGREIFSLSFSAVPIVGFLLSGATRFATPFSFIVSTAQALTRRQHVNQVIVILTHKYD